MPLQKFVFNALLLVLLMIIIYKVGETASAFFDRKYLVADGRKWSVVGSYENAPQAAELLAKTHKKLLVFMDFVRRKYHIDESGDTISAEGSEHTISESEGASYIREMIKRYDPDSVFENDPRRSSDTSYTVSKGLSTYFCLRDKKQPEILETEDDMLFVALHEASHMANYKSWAHDKQFWTVFKFVLKEARESGIYFPRDYAKYPVEYCGLTINYQPLYDSSLRNI